MASRQAAVPAKPWSRARTARQTLTRREVTDAAIALVERDGLDGLTMRRLATELGCAPMSLYTHVSSRDDLVDAIVEQLIERLDLHEQPGETWQQAVRRTLASYRDLAVQVPHAFELLALAPYDTSPVAPHLAGVLAGLEHAGLTADQARQVLGIVDAYASGFLVVWARSHAAERPSGAGVAAASTADVAGMRELATFDQGLEALIAGLDATLVSGARATDP
ncbi:TetR/AcrR family transcriptional regulator [Agromyces sp. S2-1-8]|jgi:AcrR family transcriptional regulator|uniref:TetR/AcrR family transcriptional regulator n=1 Tax=Agromyces sp. S2-1-8 TaxID=2897180 RepID=UPI001E457A42|nr:TetR/AcrR family transcriptional regulator [Agromyces sp. S2-1-8]MCD5348079.1 TetR family transcriptional regulator [Agromyces sp. S2-1-8]